jgi:hypothetical protein
MGTLNLSTLVASGQVSAGTLVMSGAVSGVTTLAGAGAVSGFTTITASGDLNINSGKLFVDVSAASVGINNANPSSQYSAYNNLVVGSGSGDEGITIYTGATSTGGIAFSDGTSANDYFSGQINYTHASGTDDAMHLHVNASRVMTMNGAGNVGINNTNCSTTLELDQGAGSYGSSYGLRIDVNNSHRWTNCVESASGQLSWYYNEGIEMRLTSDGALSTTTGALGTISDVKLKTDIVDATPKLDEINQLRVVNYHLTTDRQDRKFLGFIAQEMEQIFPGMIEENPDMTMQDVPMLDEDGENTFDEDGEILTENKMAENGEYTKSVKTTVLIPMLVKAIQELSAKVEALENA